jgi:hypothetical protein
VRTSKVLSSAGKEYRVSWVGHEDSERSWEPEANLAAAAGAVAAFENARDTRGKRRKVSEPHSGSAAVVTDVAMNNVDMSATPALALTAEVERRGLVRRDNCFTSQHRGMSWHKQAQKWHVQLQHGGKSEHLGLFATEDEAKARRDAHCLELGLDLEAATSSGFRSVGWDKTKRKWQASIKVDGKSKHLGCFEATARGEVDAVLAFDAATRAAGRPENANFKAAEPPSLSNERVAGSDVTVAEIDAANMETANAESAVRRSVVLPPAKRWVSAGDDTDDWDHASLDAGVRKGPPTRPARPPPQASPRPVLPRGDVPSVIDAEVEADGAARDEGRPEQANFEPTGAEIAAARADRSPPGVESQVKTAMDEPLAELETAEVVQANGDAEALLAGAEGTAVDTMIGAAPPRTDENSDLDLLCHERLNQRFDDAVAPTMPRPITIEHLEQGDASAAATALDRLAVVGSAVEAVADEGGALRAEVRARGLVWRGNSFTSRHKGVSWHKHAKKWLARITHGGKQQNLGLFTTEEEAKARREARCLELGLDTGGTSSTFRGVTWFKATSKWHAQISIDGNIQGLGDFEASARGEVYAALAYDGAVRAAGRPETANFEPVLRGAPPTAPPTAPPAAVGSIAAAAAAAETDSDDDWL